MVAIDQYNSTVRPSPFAGLLRLISGVKFSDILLSPTYLFRRTKAEKQLRALRIAERVSAQAGLSKHAPTIEPARLDAGAIAERLQPGGSATEVTEQCVTQTTESVHDQLDRIEYDLSVMWNEIAPFMTDSSHK